MPRRLSKADVKQKAKEIHFNWTCYYGVRDAKRISYFVRKLFREDKS